MYGLVGVMPLINSALSGLFGWYVGREGCALLSVVFMCATAALSWASLVETALQGSFFHVAMFTWFRLGPFDASWSFLFDALSSGMLVVITSVSALVHVYSIEYMGEDPHLCRFLSYLSLFTFCMVMLVTADNFVQLFFG